MPVERICKNCGRFFKTYPAWIRKGGGKFCNRSCARSWGMRGSRNHRYKGKTLTRVCKNCGTEFRIPEAWIRKGSKGTGSFCSKKCNIKHHTFETNCSFCGNPLIKPLKQKGQRTYFCNYKCHYNWMSEYLTGENSPKWKGGFDHYRGAEWGKQKKRARNRDDHTCQICSTKENLIVHHIIPFKVFGLERHEEANQLSNLLTLCRGCHSKVHKSKRLFQQGSDSGVLSPLPALSQIAQG